MFGLGRKALFARMNDCVNIVQLALYHAALQEQQRLKEKQDKRIAAALANLLTGRENNSAHTEQQLALARGLAAKLLRNQKIRFAAVMCLRTTGITGGTDSAIKVIEVIDWVATTGEIPPFPPNPDIMRQLQHDMAMQYCPDAVEPST
jgi:hypothetical protein